MSNTRRLRAVAVGLPGRPPSHQAQLLARSGVSAHMPPGVWHVSDHAAALLASQTPTVVTAVHVPSGERFQLASVGEVILGVCALSSAGQQVMSWADPTLWAQQQEWRAISEGATR